MPERTTAIAPGLLECLCCPLTRQPLREASSEELEKFAVTECAGLIREDGQILYPVRDGIPLLVPSAAISRKP